ncbi:MAG: FliM/FliN family flagellar motor switch protein [Acidobacteriota bacterium]
MSSSPTSSSSSDAADVGAAFAGLLDVRVPVSVELGTGRITVRECLALDRNRLIRLAQPAGSDLQVTANGIVLARGEVVIVEDSTALRLTEIEAPEGADLA